MNSDITNIYDKLANLKLLINTNNNFFSESSIIKINSDIQELINYIDNKYNNIHPKNIIKNYIKIKSIHPECKCYFLIKNEKELMELCFAKEGYYYYVEYLIEKTNTYTKFIKIKDKIVDGLCDDWYVTEQTINHYHIILTLEELVDDLNKY